MATYFDQKKDGDKFEIFHGIEIVCSMVFFFDLIGSLLFHVEKFYYAGTFDGIVDIVTIIPVFRLLVVPYENMGEDTPFFYFVEFLRILKVLRILRLNRLLKAESRSIAMHEDAAVSETIFSLVFALFNLFFITAGFIQMCANNFENYGFSFSDSRDADSTDQAITFDDALYFVVVTFTTVGYGDMLPTGHGSRLLMVIFIVTAFTIIPSRVADLAEAIKARSPYAHDVGKMSNHVIVTGGMIND